MTAAASPIASPPFVFPVPSRSRVHAPSDRVPSILVAAMSGRREGAGSSGGTDSNAKLGRDLRRGKRDSIDRVYEEFGATTFGFLRGMLRDSHAAEDVQQQVYLEAWQKSHTFDPARGSLLTWLLVIARSRGLDHLRRRAPEPVDPTDPGLTHPDHHTDGRIDELLEHWRVSHLLSKIPREEAEMLRLRFYNDLSQSQIAERTGVPLGTVKLRMVSGLARLRSEIESEGGLR